MSKEKHATWRAFRKQNETTMNNAAPRVTDDPEDAAQTMREMHASQFLLRNEVAPRVTDAPEDAMHTLWNSERKVMVDGKWYIPLSEVSDILTSTDGMGMPINCSKPSRFKRENNNI